MSENTEPSGNKPEEYRRFEALAKKLLEVPKKDIDKAVDESGKGKQKAREPKPA